MSDIISTDIKDEKPEHPSIDVKVAVSDLWDILRQTVDKINTLHSENVSLSERCRRMTEAIASTQNVSSEVTANTVLLEKDLEGINQSNAENLRLIASLENELSDYKGKYESIVQEKENIDNINAELEELRTNRQFVQKEIAKKNHELHSRDEDIGNLKEKIASLESQLLNVHNTKKQEAETNELVEKNRKEIQNMIIENTNLEQRYQADVSGYKQKIDSMQTELNHRDELVKNLETEIREKQFDSAANQEERISEMNQQIRRLNAMKAANEAATRQLSLKADELEKQSNILQEENRIYRDRVNELENSSDMLRQKLATIESEILSVRNQALLNEQIASENARETEGMLNKIKSKDEEILLLEEKLSEKTAIALQNDNLTRKIKSLESELIKAKNEILLKENLAKESNMRLAEKGRLVALQSEAITQKDNNLKRLRQYADSMSSEIKSSAELSGRLHQLSESKAEMEAELDELRVMKDDLEGLVKKRYKQINILEEQLNEITENNKKTKLERLELAGAIDELVVNLERKMANSN